MLVTQVNDGSFEDIVAASDFKRIGSGGDMQGIQIDSVELWAIVQDFPFLIHQSLLTQDGS